jgi:hypothetical protein
MTKEDIINIAHDAGMTPISHVSTADVICSRASLERFASLVAAAEREACAKIVEQPWQGHFREVAAQIRARGKK